MIELPDLHGAGGVKRSDGLSDLPHHISDVGNAEQKTIFSLFISFGRDIAFLRRFGRGLDCRVGSTSGVMTK
jgi:hypothetical protein